MKIKNAYPTIRTTPERLPNKSFKGYKAEEIDPHKRCVFCNSMNKLTNDNCWFCESNNWKTGQ